MVLHVGFFILDYFALWITFLNQGEIKEHGNSPSHTTGFKCRSLPAFGGAIGEHGNSSN
jgi:hypothetical protein